MTGKERILKTIRGEKTDRVPIRLDGPFSMPWETIANSRNSWMRNDLLLIDLHKYYVKNCEIFPRTTLPGSNRFMINNFDPGRVKETFKHSDTYEEFWDEIDTPKGILTKGARRYKNDSTWWTLKYPVDTLDDVEKILSIPQDGPEQKYDKFFEIQEAAGESGSMTVLVDTPMIAVSSVMTFEMFLISTLTDPEIIEEMVSVAAARQKRNLVNGINAGLGPIFRIMGSEQATPPMNGIEVYDKLVYKYEKEYCDIIHEAGHFAQIHCHGNIKEILPRFLEERVDVIDPVEAPPSGNVDFIEAKNLTAGKITLAGNIQFDDLENSTPEKIEEAVKYLFSDGKKDHVIITTSAFPTTFLTENMSRNIRALIDAGLKNGQM